MEYVPHGDLQNYLSNPIPEDEARIITRQLTEGLHQMHMNGFTHRDLKPGNILVVSRGPDWLVQILDFGISRRLRPDQSTLGTMRRGTLGFIAPEMFGFVPDRSHPYAVDIWSLGTVVFRMVTSKLFTTDLGLLQKYATAELQFPSEYFASHGVTESLASFLRSLLSPLPKDRPTITELASHDWLQHSTHPSDEGGSSEDDFSKGGIQTQDETDPSDDTGEGASAAWSTAMVSVKTAHQTHKTSATTTSSPKTPTAPGSSISLRGNSSQALEIAAKDQAHRSTLSEYNYSTEPEYPLRPARFIVDESGIIHRTEYDMTWFDVYGEMKWPPERPPQQQKHLHPDPEGKSQPAVRSRGGKAKSRQRRGTLNKSTDRVSSTQSKVRLGKQRNTSSPATTSASLKTQKGSWGGIWPWSSTSSSKTSSSKKSPPTSKRHTSSLKKSKATTQETLIMDEPLVHAEVSLHKPREITTIIRENPYVEGVSTCEDFGGNDTNSDGEDGERARFPMNSASGQRVMRFVAKQSDAENYRIPPKYDLSRWDPRKKPLLFLYCVFDLISIGTWFNDTIVSCRQYGQSISEKDMEVLKDLAILLEKLDDSLSKAIQHSIHVEKADDKEMIQDLTDGGERLVIKVQKFLQAWQGMMSLEDGLAGFLLESGAMKHLGTEKLRSKVETLEQSLRVWVLRYNAYSSEKIKHVKSKMRTGRI
ncbi:calcium calmodulin-dependent protein kinase type 1b [Colletotrichum kahawae]|uniref:Autophagy-related protein 1 n=1 Tax=Colletotrichum kahawae TaxID=34407 RepID=A0AAE0DAM7_COLKA|nr:calcium calmodulin-dependent protein kinase type 1b [Colletotrichum kahawae]